MFIGVEVHNFGIFWLGGGFPSNSKIMFTLHKKTVEIMAGV
jgi:hypothetical protein